MINPVVPSVTTVAPGAAAGGAEATGVRNAVAGGAAAAGSGPDFASVLAQAAMDAINTLKSGEAHAIAGVQGKASVQQVVESVMSAEQTLQTAVAIRDKVVAAYLDLSRMQI